MERKSKNCYQWLIIKLTRCKYPGQLGLIHYTEENKNASKALIPILPQSGYFRDLVFITLLSCSTISKFNNDLFTLCQDYRQKCFSPRQLTLHILHPDTNSAVHPLRRLAGVLT